MAPPRRSAELQQARTNSGMSSLAHKMFAALMVAGLPCTALAQAHAAPQQVIASSNRDRDWRPTASQVDVVNAQTIAYFTARDGGRLEEAWAKFSASHKATVPFGSYRASIDSFNLRAGAVAARTLRKMSWYKDAAQGSGVYAAVDFSSEFQNLALQCGYVVWQEQPDGSFAIVREEDNVIEKTTMTKLKPEDLERIRAQFRC